VTEKSLSDKVAVVTGASRGLGRAMAEQLAGAGARVAIVYRAQANAAQEVVDGIVAAGGEAFAVQADVRFPEAVQGMVDQVQAAWGRIDILVNNAGITKDNLLMMMKEDQWNDIIDTNLTSIYRLSKAVLRTMMKARKGRIINIASVVGLTGNPGQTNYSATKAGMLGFTKSLAREIGSRNITVNCVAPGLVETPLTERITSNPTFAIRSLEYR